MKNIIIALLTVITVASCKQHPVADQVATTQPKGNWITSGDCDHENHQAG